MGARSLCTIVKRESALEHGGGWQRKQLLFNTFKAAASQHSCRAAYSRTISIQARKSGPGEAHAGHAQVAFRKHLRTRYRREGACARHGGEAQPPHCVLASLADF